MSFVLFIVFFCACGAAGTTGAMFPPGPWYRNLAKPSWTPPDWLFPVAWSTLYICMSLAGTILAQAPGAGLALALWALQIALNALWTPVFFGLRRIKEGMYVLLALWVSVAACVGVFFSVDWRAGALFLPYLLWVTVAGALNATVWRLNPDSANTPPPIET